MAPAIRLARDGFPLDAVLFDRLTELYGYTDYGTDPLIGPIYFPDGLVPEIGSTARTRTAAHVPSWPAETLKHQCTP